MAVVEEVAEHLRSLMAELVVEAKETIMVLVDLEEYKTPEAVVVVAEMLDQLQKSTAVLV